MRFLLSIIFCFWGLHGAAAQKTEQDILNYVPATYQNMAFSLWSMNAYDTADDAAIDAYLQISNCPLLEQYKEDDFVWENIRAGARRELDYFADDYPNRFYIDALIALGNYNFERSAFELLPDFQFTDAGTIRFPFYNLNTQICGSDEYEHYFSRLMSFQSNTDYALMELPIPPGKANEFLEDIGRYFYPRMKRYDRIVPIRFEITVTDYDIIKDREINIIFKGDMDRIQIFKDPQRTTPIWTKQFKVLDKNKSLMP